jgi:hypothetical protein
MIVPGQQFRAIVATVASVALLVAIALGLIFYLDRRMNDAPPGGEFEWHTHLYDRHTNLPPVGKPLPEEKYGYRGFYTQPRPLDVTNVSEIPMMPVAPKILYRRPFSGSVECLIWIMGMGRKYGELQVVGDRFALARSKFECLSQNPIRALFENGETTLPTVKTVRQWREDHPWEFAHWGLL